MNTDAIHILQGTTWKGSLDAGVDLTGATATMQARWKDGSAGMTFTPQLGGVTQVVSLTIPPATSSALVTTGQRPGIVLFGGEYQRAYLLEGSLQILLANGETVEPWRGKVWVLPEIAR